MQINRTIWAATISAILLLAGCTKTGTTSAPTNASQHNQDVSNTTSESNNINSDVINATSNFSAFGKNFSIRSSSLICGATIDSSGLDSVQPFIVITYTGSTGCSVSEVRTGTVRVQRIAGAAWSDAGAVLLVTLTNYKVVYPLLNNASLTFNGSKTLTDVNGVNWLGIYFGTDSLKIRERSYNMMVTFDNGQTSLWESARLFTYWFSPYPVIYGRVNGDTTIAGQITDDWGTTRFNTPFTTTMNQAWEANSSCGWWNPIQGNYTSTTTGFTVSALFGVNSSGTQVTSGCAYGFKLNWTLTQSNTSGSAIIQYW